MKEKKKQIKKKLNEKGRKNLFFLRLEIKDKDR